MPNKKGNFITPNYSLSKRESTYAIHYKGSHKRVTGSSLILFLCTRLIYSTTILLIDQILNASEVQGTVLDCVSAMSKIQKSLIFTELTI